MKQLLFPLLFLPCLALAQYPGNAGQKITLGEQTTADGLVWRGRLADTANLLTNKLDTSVYIVLDTGTQAMWYYRASTTPKWTRLVDSLNNLQGQLSLTAKVTGVLPVANGGTGASTAFTAGSVVFAGASGTYTQDNTNLFWNNTNKRLGIGTNTPLYDLHLKTALSTQILIEGTNSTLQSSMYFTNNRSTTFNSYGGFLYGGESQISSLFGITRNDKLFLFADGANNLGMIVGTRSNSLLQFGTNDIIRMQISSSGAVTINNLAGINDVGADANGVLQAATSDINLKNTIENSPFGLNEILLLNPVTFLYNDENRKIDSDVKEVGFIAQDVFDLIPNAVSSTGSGDLQLDYRAITATLVKAIQEQQALIKALEQRILTLENK